MNIYTHNSNNPSYIAEHQFFIHTNNGDKTKSKQSSFSASISTTTFKKENKDLSSSEYIKRKI